MNKQCFSCGNPELEARDCRTGSIKTRTTTITMLQRVNTLTRVAFGAYFTFVHKRTSQLNDGNSTSNHCQKSWKRSCSILASGNFRKAKGIGKCVDQRSKDAELSVDELLTKVKYRQAELALIADEDKLTLIISSF